MGIMTGEDFHSLTMKKLASTQNNNNRTSSPLLRAISPISKRLSLNHIIPIQPMHSDIDCHQIDEEIHIFDDEELSQLQSINNNESNVFFRKRSPTQRQALFNQIDRFLGGLEECLSDEIGSLYFKKYLE